MTPRLGALVFLFASLVHAQTVRVGVFGLFHPTDLAIAPASSVLVLDLDSQPLVVEREAVRLHLADGRIHVAAGARSWTASRVGVRSRDHRPTGFVLSVPGKIHRRYEGTLEVAATHAELVPVVEIDLEIAVASVTAAESPPGAPPEALKAQAVAARSFLVSGPGGGHADFDFCDTTHCQFLREPPSQDSPAARAARDTRGMVLTYGDAPFAAMYSRSCGGRTRSLAELGLPTRGYPYYSVDCPYCRSHPDVWQREIPRESQGERARLELGREFGWSALPSNNYTLQRVGDGMIALGSGHGHGVGLCQQGAAAMAREGRSFREILAHYYPNAAIATR